MPIERENHIVGLDLHVFGLIIIENPINGRDNFSLRIVFKRSVGKQVLLRLKTISTGCMEYSI